MTENPPQIVEPCGPQNDPGLRLIWLQGRLAVLDSIAGRRWNILHNLILAEELNLSYRKSMIELARLRQLTPDQLARRQARRKTVHEQAA